MRTATGYNQAVSLLRELRELAADRDELAAFQQRLRSIVEQFSRLSGFRSRLVAGGLIAR